MNAVTETAVILLGMLGFTAIWALVYVVRRVAPHPRLPAPAQPRRQPETAPEVSR